MSLKANQYVLDQKNLNWKTKKEKKQQLTFILVRKAKEQLIKKWVFQSFFTNYYLISKINLLLMEK